MHHQIVKDAFEELVKREEQGNPLLEDELNQILDPKGDITKIEFQIR